LIYLRSCLLRQRGQEKYYQKLSQGVQRDTEYLKTVLRESKQEHLAEYLGRQEIDLEKILMAEKKNEDKGKQGGLQVPAATVKANTGKSSKNKPDCLSF
jgi:hypothetical protein